MDTAALTFSGPWIGEAIGCDSPAHVREIEVSGRSLRIRTRWEGDAVKAVPVDPQHFVIPGWDTNDTRGGIGPAYDVVFSRPGVAELSALAAYRRYLTRLSQ